MIAAGYIVWLSLYSARFDSAFSPRVASPVTTCAFTQGKVPKETAIPNDGTIPGKCFALLIATDQYSDKVGKLLNPVKDANRFGAMLEKYYKVPESQVTRLYNKSVHDIEGQFKTWQKTVASSNPSLAPNVADTLVVYIAGHGGFGTEKCGWILTKDCPTFDDCDVSNCVSHRDLTDWIDKLPCKKILILIDVCDSGRMVAAEVHPSFHRGRPDGDEVMSEPEAKTFVKEQNSSQVRVEVASGDYEVPDGDDHGSPFANKVINLFIQCAKNPQVVTEDDIRLGTKPYSHPGDFGFRDDGASFFLATPDFVARLIQQGLIAAALH